MLRLSAGICDQMSLQGTGRAFLTANVARLLATFASISHQHSPALAGFLEAYCRFELVRDPESPAQVQPVRVLFNKRANHGWNAEWEPLALMMPYALKSLP